MWGRDTRRRLIDRHVGKRPPEAGPRDPCEAVTGAMSMATGLYLLCRRPQDGRRAPKRKLLARCPKPARGVIAQHPCLLHGLKVTSVTSTHLSVARRQCHVPLPTTNMGAHVCTALSSLSASRNPQVQSLCVTQPSGPISLHHVGPVTLPRAPDGTCRS